MLKDEKTTNTNSEREEQELNIKKDKIGETPRFDIKILLSVFIGIAAVFCLMIMINGLIFHNISDKKEAYYASILVSNILFIILILIVKVSNRLTLADLGWRKIKFFPAFKNVLKIWVITWFINIIYMFILYYLGINPPVSELTDLIRMPTLAIFFVNVLIIAIIAPFIEETLFRGLLFGGLRTYFGNWSAIIISAVIFSSLHFEWAGFIPRFVLGLGLGYLYVKHNSIFPSIGLHGLNNLLAVLFISAS